MTAIMYLRYAAYKIRYGSARKAFKQMERIAMQFNNKNSDFVSIIFSEQPLRCYPKNWFDDIIYMPFETIIAPVPAAYDVLLKEHYGDYMTPVVDPTPKVWFFDADRPYAECVNDEYFYDDVMRELSIEPVDDEIGVWESLQVLYKKVVKVFKTKP